MPTPSSGETEQEFISRCMAYPDMQKYPQEQRAAICYSIWRGEAVHPDFQRIISLFFNRYGIDEAIKKFSKFIEQNGLNIGKQYNPKIQFQESFEWIEPLIKPYKQDKDAKYYLVTALTADISMNNVDYGPEDRLAREDSSMNWRPVNLNHDHSKWLPYPRTRVDFSAANEFSLEATLRVDNRDVWLQRMLDKGEIQHPSIEGRPHPISGRYHFTGLALLEKGIELPGSPLSEIVPLVFNESVGKSLCEFRDGKLVCECQTNSEVKYDLNESMVRDAIKEAIKEQTEPVMEQPEQSEPETETQPEVPHECPTGYHWSDSEQQCVPDEVGTSTATPMSEQEVPPATNAPSTVAEQDTATCPEGQHWDPDADKCVDDVKEECEEGWHWNPALQKCVPDEAATNESKLRLGTARAELRMVEAEEKFQDALETINHLNKQISKANSLRKIEREQYIVTKSTLEGRISEYDKRLRAETKRADKAYAGQMKESQAKIALMKDNDALRKDNADQAATIEKQKTHIDNIARQHKETFAENTRLSSELTEALNREIQWSKEKKEFQENLHKALKHNKYLYEFLKKHNFEVIET